MEAFETTLTGSDGNIAGIVTPLGKDAYTFTSLDDALHLTITKNDHGKWIRLSGSEPYFTGWVDELTEKIAAQLSTAKPVVIKKAEPMVKTEKKTTSTTAKNKALSAANVKKDKAKADTGKKTTATASASKKAKVSSAVAKGK